MPLMAQSPMATIARNSVFMLGIQASVKILAFLFNIYIIRRLGDVHFGRYSAVIAYVAIFAIFTDWGMSPYAIREMAKDHGKTSYLLPNIVAIRIVLSLIILLAAPLSAVWLGKDKDVVVVGYGGGMLATYQREVSHGAVDAGADLILAHHAHILKVVEVYQGKVIFYSLWNFVMPSVRGYKSARKAFYGVREGKE